MVPLLSNATVHRFMNFYIPSKAKKLSMHALRYPDRNIIMGTLAHIFDACRHRRTKACSCGSVRTRGLTEVLFSVTPQSSKTPSMVSIETSIDTWRHTSTVYERASPMVGKSISGIYVVCCRYGTGRGLLLRDVLLCTCSELSTMTVLLVRRCFSCFWLFSPLLYLILFFISRLIVVLQM